MTALVEKDDSILGQRRQPDKAFERDELIAMLDAVNLDNITPLDSLKLLSEIKHKIR